MDHDGPVVRAMACARASAATGWPLAGVASPPDGSKPRTLPGCIWTELGLLRASGGPWPTPLEGRLFHPASAELLQSLQRADYELQVCP